MLTAKTFELLNKHKVLIICLCILLFIACFHKNKPVIEKFFDIIVGKDNYKL